MNKAREAVIRRVIAMRRLVASPGATEGERDNASEHIAILTKKYKIKENELTQEEKIITHYEKLDVGEHWPRGLASVIANKSAVTTFASVDKSTNLTLGIVFVGCPEDIMPVLLRFRWYYAQIRKLGKELRQRIEKLPAKMPTVINSFGSNRGGQFTQVWNVFIDVGNTYGINMSRKLPPEDSDHWHVIVDSWGQGLLISLAQHLLLRKNAEEEKKNDAAEKKKSKATKKIKNSQSTTALVVDDIATRTSNAARWFMDKYAASTQEKVATTRILDSEYYNMGLNDIDKIELHQEDT